MKCRFLLFLELWACAILFHADIIVAQLTKITPYTAHERCVGLIELLRLYFLDAWAKTEGVHCHFGAETSYGRISLLERPGNSHMLSLSVAGTQVSNSRIEDLELSLSLPPEADASNHALETSNLRLKCPNREYSESNLAASTSKYLLSGVIFLPCSAHWLLSHHRAKTTPSSKSADSRTSTWEVRLSPLPTQAVGSQTFQQQLASSSQSASVVHQKSKKKKKNDIQIKLWGEIVLKENTTEIRIKNEDDFVLNSTGNATTIMNEARGRALTIRRRQPTSGSSLSLFSYTFSRHLPRNSSDPRYADFCGASAAQYKFLGLKSSYRIGVSGERFGRCIHEVRLGPLLRVTVISGISGTLQLYLNPPKRLAAHVPVIKMEQTECRVRIDCQPRFLVKRPTSTPPAQMPQQPNRQRQSQSQTQTQAQAEAHRQRKEFRSLTASFSQSQLYSHQQIYAGGPPSCHNELVVEMGQEKQRGGKLGGEFIRFQYWDPRSKEVIARFGIVRDDRSSTLVYRSYVVTVTREDIYIENMRRELHIGFLPIDSKYQMFYSLNFDFPLPQRRIDRLNRILEIDFTIYESPEQAEGDNASSSNGDGDGDGDGDGEDEDEYHAADVKFPPERAAGSRDHEDSDPSAYLSVIPLNRDMGKKVRL